MTQSTHRALMNHLFQAPGQEDLTFAYWRPSYGKRRMSAVISRIALPDQRERNLHGNAAFTGAYLRRVLQERPNGSGVAFLHSHLGPGWQGMSSDDIVAERDRISGPTAGRSALPLLGLTAGTDGTWSARIWTRSAPNRFERLWAETVRVVGRELVTSRRGEDHGSSFAMHSVWGAVTQSAISRARVGIVGLGSVGSIVCESLARMGVEQVTLIDHDRLKPRNLDRTAGAGPADAREQTPKVDVAARHFRGCSTASRVRLNPVRASLCSHVGIEAALDCDVLFSCVDRPLPRHLLNTIAYSHLIPVVDGGILAKINGRGLPLHVDWRIHTVGPEMRCLVCLGAVSRSDIALDRDGLLDDPDYIANLPDHDRAQASGRNVYPFSLSVASHMSLQYAKLLGAGERIGGIGPQRYHAYPGSMNVEATASCDDDCEYSQLLGSAVDPHTLLPSTIEASESEPQTRPDMVKRVCSAALRLVARSRRRPPHHPS
ncbi:MAG: ThiF family adenylyltransferase [Acidimicrobiales bacterium]